jgi:hypothetical protein
MTRSRDLQLDQRTPFIQNGSQLPGLRELGPIKPLPCGIGDSRPRVRVVKDVLRCGQWKVGIDDDGQPLFWNVTLTTLRDLAHSFMEMQAHGQQINLCYGHGDPDTHAVDPRDLIAPIDAVIVKGDRLWIASYVTPEQARDLSNLAMQVSVRTVAGYRDGAGRPYGEALLHVAVVDLPVVDGQGPFLDLANILDLAADAAQPSGADSMVQNNTSSSAAGSTTPDAGSMDDGQLALWQRAFALLGITLPDSVTPETAPVVIDALLSTAEAGTCDDDDDTNPAPPATPSDDVGATDPDGLPAVLAQALQRLRAEIRDLSQRLTATEGDKKRDAYLAKLRELASAGNINAAQRTVLERQGPQLGYDLSTLSAFDLGRIIDLSRTAKRSATPAPPAVTTEAKRPEGPEIQAGVEALHKGFVVRS